MKRDELPIEIKPRIRPIRHIDGRRMWECRGQASYFDCGWAYVGWDGKGVGRGDTPDAALRAWKAQL